MLNGFCPGNQDTEWLWIGLRLLRRDYRNKTYEKVKFAKTCLHREDAKEDRIKSEYTILNIDYCNRYK